MSSGKDYAVRLCFLSLLLLVLTACFTNTSPTQPTAAQKSTLASSPTPTPSPTPEITGPTNPDLKICQPESPTYSTDLGTAEAQGTAKNAQLWALIQAGSSLPLMTNTEMKIVWRMTGSGDFSIVAIGPKNAKVPPSQGPEKHFGSDWVRPGDEWGTVFTFPTAGCWDLHATRDNAYGDVWLKIVG